MFFQLHSIFENFRSRDIWQVVSLRNLQLKKTDPENQNNLLQQTINRIIDQDNGNYFSFLYDNTPEKNLLMIFYQNPRMKALYQRYGVILFIDGTYNVNKNKYAVYLIVVRDCHGHSQIVAWAVLAHERFVLIDTFFDVFAKNNDVSINKTIVIDKDLTERKSIENHFPNSTVFYCKFHCIQIFGRNIPVPVPTHIKCNVKPKHTYSSPIEIHIQLVVILVLALNTAPLGCHAVTYST